MPLPPHDTQVMREEAKFPHDWHLALTTTEFVVHPDLRGASPGGGYPSRCAPPTRATSKGHSAAVMTQKTVVIQGT